MEREKIIKEYERFVHEYVPVCTSEDYEHELHMAVLALLKEQEEEIENLKQTAQSMMEGICLLKEQEAVVRCKDCKKCDLQEEEPYENGYCSRCGYVKMDWFCADGRKRDEDY